MIAGLGTGNEKLRGSLLDEAVPLGMPWLSLLEAVQKALVCGGVLGGMERLRAFG